jgi:hypothetical protein
MEAVQGAVAPSSFDPGRYLTKVGSSDYLEVKWRLVWLREVHPDAEIFTELISHQDQEAVFKAQVILPGRMGSATGWGTEGLNDFRDYLEKAETKALGRALAALGFGTQFCPDFDFGGSSGSVVDSPIDFASTRGRRINNGGGQSTPAAHQGATPRQLKYIEVAAKEKGISDEDLDAEVQSLYGKSVAQLDRRSASALIERLTGRS